MPKYKEYTVRNMLDMLYCKNDEARIPKFSNC
jgi:hypothetical protein